mgnify:CR=1 FL=1
MNFVENMERVGALDAALILQADFHFEFPVGHEYAAGENFPKGRKVLQEERIGMNSARRQGKRHWLV